MKYYKCFLIVTILLSSCRFSEVEVASDYSYSGKFHKYKTFSFVNNQTFGGQEEDKQKIEHNIARVLESWGYKYKEKKPDFIISYNFYVEDVRMRGYDQPEFHSWVQNRFGDEILMASPEDTTTEVDSDIVRRRDEKYNVSNMDLNNGTIYLSFLDRKRDQSIWQGYASGVFDADEAQNDRKIRASIIRILDEFRLISIPNT